MEENDTVDDSAQAGNGHHAIMVKNAPVEPPDDEAIDLSSSSSPKPNSPNPSITHAILSDSNRPKLDPNAQSDPGDQTSALLANGAVRTLDGEIAGDELAADAMNYQILLGKIDRLLERLGVDA